MSLLTANRLAASPFPCTTLDRHAKKGYPTARWRECHLIGKSVWCSCRCARRCGGSAALSDKETKKLRTSIPYMFGVMFQHSHANATSKGHHWNPKQYYLNFHRALKNLRYDEQGRALCSCTSTCKMVLTQGGSNQLSFNKAEEARDIGYCSTVKKLKPNCIATSHNTKVQPDSTPGHLSSHAKALAVMTSSAGKRWLRHASNKTQSGRPMAKKDRRSQTANKRFLRKNKLKGARRMPFNVTPMGGSIRFRPLICTCAPWGTRVDELTES